jgi:hypothetical protein
MKEQSWPVDQGKRFFMIIIRILFLVLGLGCIVAVAWNGRWEGRLLQADDMWTINLGQTPIWSPPPVPSYSSFKETFQNSRDFPVEGMSKYRIQRVLKLDWMFLDFLLYFWPISGLCGLVYLMVGKENRDLLLYQGFTTGIGLTVAAVLCFGLWMILGGWGPPYPVFFGLLGLVLGFFGGASTFGRGRAKAQASE